MPSISLDKVNMSGRRHKVHRSVPNTTANALCYIHWHYSVVGVTVTLALLEHGSVLLVWHPAPCNKAGNKGSTFYREYGSFLRCARGVYLACCIVVDR